MKRVFWLIISIALLVFLTGISQAQKPITVKHHYVFENGKWTEYQDGKTANPILTNSAAKTFLANDTTPKTVQQRRQDEINAANNYLHNQPMSTETKFVIYFFSIGGLAILIYYFGHRPSKNGNKQPPTVLPLIPVAPPVTPPQQPVKALPDEDYTKGTGLDIKDAIEKGADIHIVVTPYSRETKITHPKNRPPITNNDNRKITNIHQANTSKTPPKDLPGGGEKPRGNSHW